MSREIKEADWKLLRQLHSVALERYCERVVSEIAQLSGDNAQGFHQRYLEIFTIIERRDKEIAETFNDLRRSTALFRIAAFHARGLLTPDEFSRFSDETRSIIAMFHERSA